MTKSAVDRRAHSRQAVVPNQAALDWGSDSSGDCRVARLLDISRGGALLESPEAPPSGQIVWLRLQAPAETPWATATVVRREPGRVGVQFKGDCPNDLMLAATLGISLKF